MRRTGAGNWSFLASSYASDRPRPNMRPAVGRSVPATRARILASVQLVVFMARVLLHTDGRIGALSREVNASSPSNRRLSALANTVRSANVSPLLTVPLYAVSDTGRHFGLDDSDDRRIEPRR